MSFASDVAKFAKLTNSSLDETGRAIVLELFSSIIKDTPVDTGRARGNWQTSIGTPKDGQVTRDGEGPALAEAASETAKFGMGKLVWLSNNLPYIYRLEYLGWSKQSPDGMARKNVARIQSIVRKAVAGNKV
jgi:hypothetical protein